MIRINAKRVLISLVENMMQVEGDSHNPLLYQEGELLQDSAMSVGTVLETESNHEEIVQKLEEYCELVYQGSMSIQEKKQIEWRYKILEDTLSYVRNMIAGKNKIVFMPYKYCMWDSMESVYDAACRDTEDWDVKVLPLPYRYKDTGAVCYEGEYFGDLTGFVCYEEYHLEIEKPDIIIIHNPYDQYNKVTEVFREYFSSELRKYTTRLVYIPYYINQFNSERINRMILPGVKNATDIFVQSEVVRQQYRYWNPGKNIYAVGSPKIDRIVRAAIKANNSCNTFFLNTHLAMILSEPEQFLKRTEELLLYFKGHPELYLIWRPHPMSLHTFETEESKKAFERLLLCCKDFDNILLDESEDFIDSLLKADAYIGDRSSLMVLFGMQGKPMYIYDLEKDATQLDCMNCCVAGDRLWMLGVQSQIVFSVDFSCENPVLEYVIVERGDGECGNNERFHYLEKREQELFLFPGEGTYMCIVDLGTGEMQEVSLLGRRGAYQCYRPQDIIEFKGIYYIFPACFDNPLLWFDGKEIRECEGWIETMRELAGRNMGLVSECVLLDAGKAWMVLEETNRLVCTSLEDMSIEYYDIPVEGYFIDIMQKQGELFWMAPWETGKIIAWSVENGIVREYDDFPPELKFSGPYSFSKIICLEDSVWFLPRNVNGILILDLNKDKFEMINLPENFCREGAGPNLPKTFAYVVSGNQLILPACGGKYYLIIDIEKRKIIRKVNVELSKKDFVELYRGRNVWLQGKSCRAEDFIEDVRRNYHLSEWEKKHYLQGIVNPEVCGEKIWQRICQMI